MVHVPEQKIQNKMKTYKAIVLTTAVIILFIGLISMFYSMYTIREVRFVDMDFEVKDGVAFNLDNDSLHFGGGPPGGGARRNIDISHKYNKPVLVVINNYGNISTMMEPIEEFELKPGEKKEVTYSIKVPVNATYGQYTGYSKITFKRII